MKVTVIRGRAVLGLVAVGIFLATSVSAAGVLFTNDWQAVGGVWDGDWNDAAHWTLGSVPSGSDQYVRFRGDAGVPYTVTVTDDCSVASIDLQTPENSGSVQTTFKGDGSLAVQGELEFAYVREYHPVVFDGVGLTVSATIQNSARMSLTNGATVRVENLRPMLRAPSINVYDGCALTVTDSILGSRTELTIYAYEGAVVSIDTIDRYASYANPTRLSVRGGTVTVNRFKSFSPESGATVESGSLTIRAFSFSDSGCSFELNGGTTIFGSGTSFCGILRPEWFSIAADAEIVLTVGSTYLLCAEGSLPDGAVVKAVIPEGLEPAGYMVVRGWRDDTLTAAQREAVSLEGATVGADAGWALNRNAGGHVVAWKRSAVGAGADNYYHEWTGATNDGDFSNPSNWMDGNGATAAKCPYADKIGGYFGSSDKTVVRSPTASEQIRGWQYLKTAVDSFVYENAGSGYLTLYSCNLKSASVLPQYFGAQVRIARAATSVGSVTCDAAGAVYVGNSTVGSPFVFKWPKTNYANLVGDVRLRTKDGSTEVIGVKLAKSESDTVPFTRLTVDCGTISITNVLGRSGLAVAGGAFDVEAGAKLVYKNASWGYLWTAEPSDCRINGTFDIQAPLIGGQSQVYGGSGILKTAEIRPDASGDTTVALKDALVLEPSQDWTTANGTAPTNVVRLAVTAGSPTIRLAQDWTYGPGEGTTQTTEAGRALDIANGATLTVDADGHRATFEDPLTGRGMLIVTNGTVKIDYAQTARVNLRVRTTGVFEWTGSNTCASLNVQPGGVLRPLAAQPLVFTSAQGAATATLTGSILDVDRSLIPAGGYLTVVRSQKKMTGLPTLTDGGLRCRMRTVDGFNELQVKQATGLAVIFR